MISRVEIKGDWVIKGIRGDGLKKIIRIDDFDWENLESFTEEIFLHDVTATLFKSRLDFSKFKCIRQHVSRPMIYGGGVNSIENIDAALNAGFDRVYICSGALSGLENNTFLEEAVSIYGSSTILIGCELVGWQNQEVSNAKPSYARGRFKLSTTLKEIVTEIRSIGGFEICLLDFDHEGTGHGFDFSNHKFLEDQALYPIIWGGGGSLHDLEDDTISKNFRSIRTGMFSLAALEKLNLLEQF